LPGELLAAAMEDILALGAWGAQAMPTITKKNRPGVLLIIEPGGAEERITEYLARELKIGGFQRFDSAHMFHQARFTVKKFLVQAGGKEAEFDLRVKTVGPEDAPLYSTVEADDAMMIVRELEQKHGIIRSFHLVKGALDLAAASPEPQAVVRL